MSATAFSCAAIASDIGLLGALTDFVNRADMWVIQLRRGTRLADQTGTAERVAEGGGGQHFDGHVPVKLFVACPVDIAHPARSDLGRNAEMTEVLANHGLTRSTYRTPSLN